MIYNSIEQTKIKKSIVTIGVFDGVHQGHEWLLNHLLQSRNQKNKNIEDNGYRAVVVTFDPHPEEILFGKKSDFYLSTTPQKIERLKILDIDDIVVIPFSKEIACYTAKEFVRLLCEHLDMKELWVGDDFALGKDRVGTILKLTELGEEFDFSVQKLTKKSTSEEIISSSTIRNLLKNGELQKANTFLHSNFTLTGEVVIGDQRGRTIGFPTANLSIDEKMLIPKFGVYAAYASYDQQTYKAVVNIGIRPTFDATELRIEAHLLDFPNQDIYGEILSLQFIEFIRDESKFNSLDDLMHQIQKDSQKAASILTLS